MRRQTLALLERTASTVLPVTQSRCLSAAVASTSGRLPLASVRLLEVHTASFSPVTRTLRTQAQSNEGIQGSQHQQSRSMFIQTSATPNPASMMFLPGEKVMQSGSKSFDSARDGLSSPLAKRLFVIDGVTGVFFGSDFVTVTKSDEYVWSVLKPEIFAAIMEHFTSGDPLFTDLAAQTSNTAISEDDSEVVAMIKELLETRIRPAVMEDGGDIVFEGFDEETGQVVLKMQGACSGCPSSSLTLKSGIENMLMHYIPEVKEVIEAPADEAELASLEQFAKLEQHLSA